MRRCTRVATLLLVGTCGCAGPGVEQTGRPALTSPALTSPALTSPALPSPAGMPGPTSTGERRVDGAELRHRPPLPASAQNPAFSPDGSTVLFTVFHRGYNEGPAGLYLLPIGGGPPVELLDEPDQDAVNLPGSSWSAASGRIALTFDSIQTDEIWTVNPDGSDLRRVTSHASAERYLEPSFSPDGRWIAFEVDVGPEDPAEGRIYKVRVDGSGLTPLTDGPAARMVDRQPNWSPAGDRIVFQRRARGSDAWDLYTMAPDGTDLRLVGSQPSSETDASWAPDGRSIVYSGENGDGSAIFVVPADGGVPRRVTNVPGAEDAAPSWSPDGTSIWFESRAAGDETAPATLWSIPAPTPVSAVDKSWGPGLHSAGLSTDWMCLPVLRAHAGRRDCD